MVDWKTSVEDSTLSLQGTAPFGAAHTFVPQKHGVIVEGPFKREHYCWVCLQIRSGSHVASDLLLLLFCKQWYAAVSPLRR